MNKHITARRDQCGSTYEDGILHVCWQVKGHDGKCKCGFKEVCSVKWVNEEVEG